MTKQDDMTPVEQGSVRVVRDGTFVRFLADEAVITALGRDLDVGFLQYGPLFLSQTDLGDAERTDAENVVTEVARMRMAQPAFLAMVMNFLEAGIVSGLLKGEAVQRSVVQWVDMAAAAQAKKKDKQS